MNNKNNQNKLFLKQDTIKRGQRWKECGKLIRKNRKIKNQMEIFFGQRILGSSSARKNFFDVDILKRLKKHHITFKITRTLFTSTRKKIQQTQMRILHIFLQINNF